MFNNCVCVSISEIVFKGMSCGMVLGVLSFFIVLVFHKKKKKKKKIMKKKKLSSFRLVQHEICSSGWCHLSSHYCCWWRLPPHGGHRGL
jgi:hypothetical protein